MSENVHLYDTPEKQSHYGDFDTISAALSYAADPEHPYSTAYIVCDPEYEGENNPISSDINASVEIQAYHLARFDSSSSISLNGSIKLEDDAQVLHSGPYFTAGVNIILNSAELLTGTTVSAGGDITVSGDEAKILPLNDYDNQLVISAGGSITVSGYDAKICGTSIYAGESIVLENITGSTTASIIGDSGIKANSGDITLGRHAQMISDTSVYAGGSIIVSGEEALIRGETASCSTVYAGENITVSGYNAQIDGASVYAGGNIAVSGYNAQMISDTSVYAGGNIAVSGEGAVIYGSTVSAAGSIDVGAQAKVLIGVDWWDAFGIKLNGDGKKLVAGTSINVAGTIDVGTAATIEADEITITSGNIVLASGAQMIAGSINVDGSVTNNNSSIFLKNVESTLKATSISGANNGTINLNLTGLGTTYTDDLYILVDGTIDEGTISISVNDDSLSWNAIKAGECKYGPDNVYTLVARPATSSTTSLLYLKKNAPSTLYVNTTYTGDPGTFTPDGHMIGYNAFRTAGEASAACASTTKTISFAPAEESYGVLNISNAADAVALSNSGESSVTIDSLTMKNDGTQTVTLSGKFAVAGALPNRNTITIGTNDTASSLDVLTELSNLGNLTVIGIDENDRSSLRAESIVNSPSYGSMSITNTVLNTETLVNTCVGTVDNKPGITITNSEAVVGSLSNGNDYNRVATIKIENSEFTADSVTNYSKGPVNEYSQLIRPGIEVMGSVFVAGSLTNCSSTSEKPAGRIRFTNSTVRVGLYDNDHKVVTGTGDIANNADAWITVGNSEFTVLGTLQNRGSVHVYDSSTLNIGTLDGTITVGAGAILAASSITGGGTNGGTISAQNSLTFTGANTLNGVTLDATGKTVTIGNDDEIADSLTVKGTSTLNIGTLNGEIKTAASTTLQNSNITGGSITALGTIEVKDSTISSNTFTAKVYEVDFSGACILDGVNLDMEMYNVPDDCRVFVSNGDTLTISGGTLSTGKLYGYGTVTVTGENELHIRELYGDGIKLDDATIKDSSIVGGMSGNYGGTLLVEADKTATFSTTGSNRNNSLANTSIINSGTITVNGKMTCGDITNNAYSTFTLSNADFTAGTVTNLAETGGSTGSQISVTNSTFRASTVSVNFYADFYVSGESTLDITNLTGTIQLNDGATISNSAVYAAVNKGETTTTYQGKLLIAEGSNVTLAGENTFLSDDRGRGSYVEIKGAATVKSTSNKKGNLKAYFINNNTLGGNLTVGSETDACSLDAIALYNRGAITVQGNKNDQERSNVSASEIKNEDDNAWMTFIYSELTVATIKNYGRGEFDPGPPRTSQAAITISDSTVSITDSLTNGAANNTSATIEFNNSTVTANSVTNYGIDNGTGGNTGRAGFIVNDSTFTVNNTLTNHGWIYVNNSTLHATSLVNNNKFCVYGTSTLNIGTLTGRIDIINGNDTGSLLTLNNSHITGKVNDDGSLGSSIYVSNPLTFTGTNTLTNTQFYATAANKTVTVDSGATLTVGGTSTLSIASLDGTILTDSAATTTLTASSITGGTITAQDALTFTGANTLNSVTLTATDKTVTVGTGATLTVGGTSTLNIGTLGGTITAANGATLSNSSVGGTVKVQSGATLTLDGMNTITTLDLSEATGVVMDWQDQLSFTGFSGDYEGKLTINLNNFTAGDLSKPILDYTGDTVLTDVEAMYRALLNNETTPWSSSEQGSTQYTFKVVNGDLYLDLQEIVVNGGTFEDITQLNGIKTEIQGTTTEFTKAVYGGTKVDAADSVTRNTDVTIKTGTFDRFFVGGNNIAMPEKDTVYTVTASKDEMQSVAISGGEFSAIVATADRVQKGKFTLNSDMELNITGGQFDYCVTGGLLNSLYEKDGDVEKTNGTADIYGNVSLNITGGTFANDCWIYGGCVSTSRSVSSYASTIYGDVTVTIDCGAGNAIQLSHLVAGSHGLGQILEDSTTHSGGNTAIVFKGNGAKLSFTANGELWGGCGRDNVSQVTGKCAASLVEGDRLLSFEGFKGEMNCTKIRDFSSIQLIGNSVVGLTETTVDLKGIENWTIENGSSLSGSFQNNFKNDSLYLNGFIAGSYNLITDTNVSDTNDAFAGLKDISELYLDDQKVTIGTRTDTSLAWSASGSYLGGSLAIENGVMQLTLA